ncbi:flagellar assembly protein FliX [Brevundimonas sp. PAMC22021]|uniref:flagellar assembly protein FliX n=1 Tax=Brevundimonas sp. PAMC22021 TaxID=2861285 RepID=UPI001C631C03|nr:flagellar assembly protein FliX [Brevundimonas sp. PAMC22021]QYF87716.1 flagellar assembly protein FliX [Brevundimonas sp. PAMC22021]
MKITGSTGPRAAQGSAAARPQSGAGFSVAGPGGASAAASPAAASATSSASGVTNVSALMALQGVETATERRRRAIRRGGGLLDRLDELTLALLSGEAGEPALERLARGLREDRPEEREAGLSELLDQIDLRASVELAKAEMRRAAA